MMFVEILKGDSMLMMVKVNNEFQRYICHLKLVDDD